MFVNQIYRLTIGVEWSNVAELVDSDILSDAITFIQLETSIGVLCAPLLGGWISDKTGDYSYVFYIAGVLLYCGAGCALAGDTYATFSDFFRNLYFLDHCKNGVSRIR